MTNSTPTDPSNERQSWLEGRGFSGGEDFVIKPIFMMCRPDFYDPRIDGRKYVENHMSSARDTFDRGLAQAQFDELKDTLTALGASVILSPGRAGLYDQVFKADPSLTIAKPVRRADGSLEKLKFTTLRSNFYHQARAPETQDQSADIAFLQTVMQEQYGIDTEIIEFAPVDTHGEGTGDNVYDPARDMFWCGYKPKNGEFNPAAGRSDYEFHQIIEAKMGMHDRAIPLEVNGKFFHIDTSLAPLPRGHIVCHREGMTERAFMRFRQRAFAQFGIDEGEYLIDADGRDADGFACNLIAVDNENLVTSRISPSLRDALEQRGYNVHQVDLSLFNLGGGGAHCMTNRVNQTRPETPLLIQDVA